MAHPVRQRRGVLTGPDRGYAEPHDVRHLGLAGGSLQAVPVGGPHDYFGLVEDQHRPEPLGLQQAQRLGRRGVLPGRGHVAAGEHSC